MTQNQRTSLIEMAQAVLNVGNIDEFTKYRAHRLLSRLVNKPFFA